jgi:hypothetical protein
MELPLKSLLDFPAKRTMTQEECGVFLRCCLASNKRAPLENVDFPGFRIIKSRIPEEVNADIDPWLVLLCTNFTGTPGEAVLWAYTLTEMSYRKKADRKKAETGNGRLTVSDFADFFPWGVPPEESLRACWEAQKDGGANKMDREENWRPTTAAEVIDVPSRSTEVIDAPSRSTLKP